MIKPAVLEEELFIVLIPERKDLNPALKLQKDISEQYNLYEGGIYPQLHITLDRINKDALNSAKNIIRDISKKIDEIDIRINNFKCLQIKEKFLVLQVNKTESLLNLSNKLHNRLTELGISTIDNYNEWEFHMSLISNQFAKNKIPEKDLSELCLTLDGIPQNISTKAKEIQIWRPTLDPEKKCIASFKL
ncbi:hypothetical protein [Orenia marismortui]|uniref:hypothetical protein n=1 Tax=Orenia marismortui TaxID=46469 RepID=UPI000373EA67|nr:hypothetical protein [Orenia marismortui]